MEHPLSGSARGARPRRRGGALLLASAGVAAVAVVSVAFLQVVTAVAESQELASDTDLAFYLAEAGLSEATAGIAVGKTGVVGSPERPAVLGRGLFWVTAEELGDGRLRLESTGMLASARARVSLVVQRGRLSIASLGIFALEEVDVPDDAVIDVYESKGGSGGPGAGEEIFDEDDPGGEAASGWSGGSGGLLRASGDDANEPSRRVGLTEPQDVVLPPVSMPTVEPLPGVKHDGAATLLIEPGRRGFEFLHLKSGARAVVEGPALLYLGELEVDEGAELVLDTTGGDVDVFVRDELKLKSGALLATSSEDPRVSLQYAGEKKAELEATATFHGMVYAPLAEVKVSADFELFGALVARALDLANAVQLHQDLTVSGAAKDASLYPRQLSWQLEELHTASATGGDPFRLLGLDPAQLPSPSDAHEDQLLGIEYVDAQGSERTYEGWESDFDWSDVREATTVGRWREDRDTRWGRWSTGSLWGRWRYGRQDDDWDSWGDTSDWDDGGGWGGWGSGGWDGGGGSGGWGGGGWGGGGWGW